VSGGVPTSFGKNHVTAQAALERLLLDSAQLTLERARELRREVDRAPLVDFRRLELALVDRALDGARALTEVDVARLEREGLAGAHDT
jgi:hypothetical protein